ncbi:unnamed protein product [Prorocentrum cordatum]|uniref:Uncharacterized protein n=1 Tax=Prorocentrum cordatum TaxID=2364126 RepID=A0ABN9XGA7_9DINO|nr:unnamed protein product [Polarella glacialis]
MASRRPPPQRVSLPLVLSGAATPGLQATCVAEPGLDLEAYPKSNEALTSLTAPPEDETFSVRYMATADDPPPPPTPQRPAAERPEQGRARGGLPREGEPFEADELPWQTGASQAAACAPPGRAAPPSGDLDLCMGVAERPSLGPGARGPSRWPCALPGSPGPLADCGALQRSAGLVRCGSARSVRSAASTKTASDIFDSALLKTPDGARAPSSASSARSRVLVVESPPGSSPLGGPFAGAPSCAGAVLGPAGGPRLRRPRREELAERSRWWDGCDAAAWELQVSGLVVHGSTVAAQRSRGPHAAAGGAAGGEGAAAAAPPGPAAAPAAPGAVATCIGRAAAGVASGFVAVAWLRVPAVPLGRVGAVDAAAGGHARGAVGRGLGGVLTLFLFGLGTYPYP